MSSETSQHIRTVELDWYAEDETVTVTPRDQKRFEIQKERAIEKIQPAGSGGTPG